ncbi:MAG: ABC transporter ATP-binding protein, partial [Bacteroidia bacterium]
MPILSVKKISYNYFNNSSFKGIKNISFEVKQGEILTVLGKSGGGKSTLLKCIYGLVDLPSGEITFEGERVLGPAYNLIPGHAEMKLVSQDYYVLENNSVEENLREMLSGYADDYKQKRIKEVLKALELTKYATKRAKELSSGQKQRLSLARALAEFPKLLLLDEPFSNLDFSKRDKLFAFIRENIIKNESSCIFVTHHPEEAMRYSDDLIIIDEGKIIAHNHPEKIYRKPETIEIAKLFGKCYLLDKKDFAVTTGVKFTEGKCMLRPEQLKKL